MANLGWKSCHESNPSPPPNKPRPRQIRSPPLPRAGAPGPLSMAPSPVTTWPSTPTCQERDGYAKADAAHLDLLLNGCIREAADLDAILSRHVDRKTRRTLAHRHAVLMIGAYELNAIASTCLQRVAISRSRRAGHLLAAPTATKYVNGVLDKTGHLPRPAAIKRPSDVFGVTRHDPLPLQTDTRRNPANSAYGAMRTEVSAPGLPAHSCVEALLRHGPGAGCRLIASIPRRPLGSWAGADDLLRNIGEADFWRRAAGARRGWAPFATASTSTPGPAARCCASASASGSASASPSNPARIASSSNRGGASAALVSWPAWRPVQAGRRVLLPDPCWLPLQPALRRGRAGRHGCCRRQQRFSSSSSASARRLDGIARRGARWQRRQPTRLAPPSPRLASIVDVAPWWCDRGGVSLVDGSYQGRCPTRTPALRAISPGLGDAIVSVNSFSNLRHDGLAPGLAGAAARPRRPGRAAGAEPFICPKRTIGAVNPLLACFEPASMGRSVRTPPRRVEGAPRLVHPALNALGLTVPVMPDGRLLRLDRLQPCGLPPQPDSWTFAFDVMQRAQVTGPQAATLAPHDPSAGCAFSSPARWPVG